jgi:hypothetical protein
MSVRNAGYLTRRQRIGATPAEPGPTELRPKVAGTTSKQSKGTPPAIPKSAADGSTSTSNESANGSPIFVNSEKPSSISTRSWKSPRNVKEFAAQTNMVATMVLRGDIELERARVYSGLARTVAQAMSTEVSRSRFLAQEPDLSLEEEDG